ncbi:MAG: ABC transporter permease subunit [Azospirillaceae bacterium]|nr:ABC transporter permease subunit [Azospirillaceae bacterium]
MRGGRSPWRDAGRRLMGNRAAVVALVLLAAIVLLALVAPWLNPNSYDDVDWDYIATPPTLANHHWFGTDAIGRDLFVRTLLGARVSLMVGLVATGVALVIGVVYGAVAGYAGGRVDALMMRLVDVLYAMPLMFFVIILMVVFGRSILLVFAAIGGVEWLTMARIVRGQTLALKRREFVDAARAAGVRPAGILAHHIIPNLMGPVIVYVTLLVPAVILVESFLSFLGLGVQEPMTSWGVLIADGAQEMEVAPHMLFFPAAFLTATLFCFNLIGEGLRGALEPGDR